MSRNETSSYLSIRKKIEGLMPSFHTGISSVLTFGRNQSTYQELMNKSINDGLKSDWYTIGKDIQTAINKYKAEISCQRN